MTKKAAPGLWIILSFALFACGGNEEDKVNIIYGTGINGLAMPVQLEYDSTRIPLGDFVEFPDKVDSVYFNVEINYSFMPDSGMVMVYGVSDQQQVVTMGIAYEGVQYHVPVFKNRSQSFRFTYDSGNSDAREVAVKGNFNGWNYKATLLRRDDDAWTAELILPPGLYEYLIVEDGREMLDQGNPMRKDNGKGGYNSAFQVGSDAEPPYIHTYGMAADSVVMFYPTDLLNPLIFWENHILDQAFYHRRSDRLAIAMPAAAAALERSHLRVYGCNEEARSNDVLVPLQYGKPVMESDSLSRSDKHTYAMYFMMVDRFVNGDSLNDLLVADPEILPPANYYGGDLAGVKQKIDEGYFNELGTNTIWLSPIVQNPLGAYGLWDKGGVRSKFSGYHGYWPISSTAVDFRFGEEATLQALIEAAHGSQANVILDYVANHVHQEHPVYQQYPEWATNLYLPDGRMNTELWDEQRLTTWFDTFLPTLNLQNPQVAAAMTDSALYWFEKYPIDGFRHDATKHIPLSFWRELTRKLKYRVVVPEGRAIYQIGETYGNAELIGSYVGSGLLDGQFDFNLYDAAISAFAKDGATMYDLNRVISQSLAAYGYHNLMGNISGNQDRARFISYADGSVDFAEDAKLAGWTRRVEVQDEVGYQRLAMLHALNFTLPGIPVIYYGDEIGLPGANDPDNRRMMRFGNQLTEREKAMLETVSKIANLRKDNMALLYGDLQVMHIDAHTYAYTRRYFDQTALVFFNNSDQVQSVSIALPKTFQGQNLKANFGNEFYLDVDTLTITLLPTTFEVLTL